MDVTFLGTGSAMPVPERVQTGLLLERGDRTLLVDCGAGVLHRLSRLEGGYESVASVLLTHHHLDHVADLLPLLKARWLAGETHLEIAGPPGTKALVDELLDVHDYLRDRVDLRLREVHAGSAFEIAGFDIEAFETRHSMTCFAYRFADGDFTYSGDSEAFAGLANFADGSRVLVHDCSFPDGLDVSNHPTPTQLGKALAGTDIDRLYLTHRYPQTEGKGEALVESVRAAGFDGEVRLARDGIRVTV
ncbi:metal-dependent hydrolase, beta-lactamase superfamily III [Halalkaliarchaeum desulfuricum]|uniref:Metal-dependent hydrolase, beta-lactamase superfamily III n=1 Tax=Halalkaliarchaeum desulfuricum TaxID=2055893 RepID=A0A343TML1_9EURY|nr:MBL fold metallo-hydrolase [Halalkaliarchaeum desulfuricum]AUX10333.1 metal-dependent hydrolase, beta-lactamase superfamily III [Halalkaliarchaeum desulfuricum]